KTEARRSVLVDCRLQDFGQVTGADGINDEAHISGFHGRAAVRFLRMECPQEVTRERSVSRGVEVVTSQCEGRRQEHDEGEHQWAAEPPRYGRRRPSCTTIFEAVMARLDGSTA